MQGLINEIANNYSRIQDEFRAVDANRRANETFALNKQKGLQDLQIGEQTIESNNLALEATKLQQEKQKKILGLYDDPEFASSSLREQSKIARKKGLSKFADDLLSAAEKTMKLDKDERLVKADHAKQVSISAKTILEAIDNKSIKTEEDLRSYINQESKRLNGLNIPANELPNAQAISQINLNNAKQTLTSIMNGSIAVEKSYLDGIETNKSGNKATALIKNIDAAKKAGAIQTPEDEAQAFAVALGLAERAGSKKKVTASEERELQKKADLVIERLIKKVNIIDTIDEIQDKNDAFDVADKAASFAKKLITNGSELTDAELLDYAVYRELDKRGVDKEELVQVKQVLRLNDRVLKQILGSTTTDENKAGREPTEADIEKLKANDTPQMRKFFKEAFGKLPEGFK